MEQNLTEKINARIETALQGSDMRMEEVRARVRYLVDVVSRGAERRKAEMLTGTRQAEIDEITDMLRKAERAIQLAHVDLEAYLSADSYYRGAKMAAEGLA